MGRDSGQATDAFKLLKMFVKGKGPFEFERPHHGEACAVGKTEILVSVSFKNIKRRVLNRRGNCDNFNEAALLQVLAEKDSDMMRNPRPEVIHRLADNEVCGDKPRPLFLCISVKGSKALWFSSSASVSAINAPVSTNNFIVFSRRGSGHALKTHL